MRGLPFRAAELAAVLQDVIDATTAPRWALTRPEARNAAQPSVHDLGMPAEGPIADAITHVGGDARREADAS